VLRCAQYGLVGVDHSISIMKRGELVKATVAADVLPPQSVVGGSHILGGRLSENVEHLGKVQSRVDGQDEGHHSGDMGGTHRGARGDSVRLVVSAADRAKGRSDVNPRGADFGFVDPEAWVA